jgi:uncharacterized membrane protein
MSTPAPERCRPPRRRRGPAGRWRARALASALIGGGTALGWAVPRWEPQLPWLALDYQAATAQATLAAIAGAMITLSGFVVTAIILVVQTAQGMSPRLVGALRHMGRYTAAFALLVGTALYALTALSGINSERVPRLTVTVAVGLVLINAIALPYLLGSLRDAVTGGGMARAVGERLRAAIAADCPTSEEPPRLPAAGAAAGQVVEIAGPARPGIVQGLDEYRMVRLAARAGSHVEIWHVIGDFVESGAEAGRVHHPPGAPPTARWMRRLAGCVTYGPSRWIDDDMAYGLRLLADIAIRALSPAVNDPSTAVQALDQIEDALTRLADRALGPCALLDRDGVVRVVFSAPRWPDLVSLGLDETLQYGAGSLQVARRMRLLLDRVQDAAPPHRQPPLAERRALLDRLIRAGFADPALAETAARADVEGLGSPSDIPTRGEEVSGGGCGLSG